MSETDDFEYTLTRKALRQIKAEAWDEGYTRGFYAAQILPSDADASEGGGTNPHREYK